MSTSKQFSEVLIRWTGVFMRRSVHDFMNIMKEQGLSMPQISTLMRLYYQHECDVSSVGSAVGVTNAAASQMVERLVQQGLLERNEDPDDRRVKVLTLTDKGRQVIEAFLDSRRRWMEQLTSVLSPADQRAIIHAMGMLTDAAQNLEKEPSKSSQPAL